MLPGLEVLSPTTNKWMRVPHANDSLIVISGHSLEKLTNGLIPATIHRVINHTKKYRHATALFLDPNPESKIAPLEMFCSKERPCAYTPCEAGKKGVEFKTENYGFVQ